MFGPASCGVSAQARPAAFGLASCGTAAAVRCALAHVGCGCVALHCTLQARHSHHSRPQQEIPVRLRQTPARRRRCRRPFHTKNPIAAAQIHAHTGNGLSDKPQLFSARGTQWTIDDYVEKDVPAIIRFVLKETKAAQVHFLGHSMVRSEEKALLWLHSPLSVLYCLGGSIVRHSGRMHSAEVSADAC